MQDIKLVEVEEEILTDNNKAARELREWLKQKKVFLLNLMSSPGAGKTSLIVSSTHGVMTCYRSGIGTFQWEGFHFILSTNDYALNASSSLNRHRQNTPHNPHRKQG